MATNSEVNGASFADLCPLNYYNKLLFFTKPVTPLIYIYIFAFPFSHHIHLSELSMSNGSITQVSRDEIVCGQRYLNAAEAATAWLLYFMSIANFNFLSGCTLSCDLWTGGWWRKPNLLR